MLTSSTTLSAAYLAEASLHPERPALVSGGTRLTYGALAERIRALAGGLARLGVGRGDRVATLLPASWEATALFFATAHLGAVWVPLNPMLRKAQLGRILAEAEPTVLVVAEASDTSETPQSIEAVASEAGVRYTISVGAPFDRLLDEPVAKPEEVAPDDLAVVLYTSGTTGVPKGVMHSHRSLIAPVVASIRLRRMWLHKPAPAQIARMPGLVARYGMRLLQAAGRPQVFLTAMGPHAIGGIELLLQTTLMGDKMVLMRHFNPVETLRLIEAERATVLVAVPLALSVLMRIKDLDRYDLSSLLIVGTGSTACPPDLARQIQERLGCAIHIGFGTTEIGGGISATAIEDSSERQAETVGRPLDGMQVRIVDDQRRALPFGQVGELAVFSESRMLGYYRSPDHTGEVIDAEGWYYTGDLGVIDEHGFIRIVGRKKDVIVRSGQNIYPAEVERFLQEQPGVQEAAVVGVPGGPAGERVWAFVIPEPEASLSPQQVLERCRAELEAFRVPDQVRFVTDLPRSQLGKVQKSALREMALSEAEEKDGPPAVS